MTAHADQPVPTDLACTDSICTPNVESTGHWLGICIGLLVAAQTMTLGLAVSLTPPEDAGTREVLNLGMLAATALVGVLLGRPLLVVAGAGLRSGRLSIELFFLVGIAAALGISCRSAWLGEGPVFFEVVAILLAVSALGRAFQTLTRQRALSATRMLTASTANARRLDGTNVPVEQIAIGDSVLVRPGEPIPIDGRVLTGRSLVRRTAFTGELTAGLSGSLAEPGTAVSAGEIAEDGSLTVEATAAGDARRLDRLAATLAAAVANPTGLQRTADAWSARFLPLVLLVSAATCAYWAWAVDVPTGLFHGLAVLLVACPCAAGLATPLAVWEATLRLARRGLVLHSGDVLERLASADSVIFDKTGTLAEERLALRDIEALSDDVTAGPSPLVLAVLAAVESHSNHPVARLLAGLSVPSGAPAVRVGEVRLRPGLGVEASLTIDGRPSVATLLRSEPTGVQALPGELGVVLTLDGRPTARVRMCERLRNTAVESIGRLRALGLAVQVMTGDAQAGSADQAGFGPLPIQAGLCAEAKHEAVLALRDDPHGAFRRPVFVGDGQNDAAAMAAAHVGIALAHGDTLTVRSAGATLHGGDLTLLPEAVELARRTVATVRSALSWAAGYNLLGVTAAALGWLHPIWAAVLMAASSAWVARRAACLDSPSTNNPGVLAHNTSRPTTDQRPSSRARSFHRVAHSVGFAGQGLLLIPLAELGGLSAFVLLGAVAAGLWLLPRIQRWVAASDAADMALAMYTLGGLGMNLGWWVDRGFQSAIVAGEAVCCHGATPPPPGMVAGSLLTLLPIPTQSPAMFAGMLLLGVPAMYLLRSRPRPFDWRSSCCVWPLVLGVPGMLVGMILGAGLVADWPSFGPHQQVLMSYLGMMAGMTAGMSLGHLPEWLTPPEPNRA